MISNAGAAQRTARVIYPELPDPLTPDDLHRLFSSSYDEREWAPTVARTPASQVALLVQLKMFQTIGRFRRAPDIPVIVVEYVASQFGVKFGPAFVHPDRTLYRHRPAVLKRLGVTPWGATARELAQSTMIKTAKARTDPADIINAAADALIRHRFELPVLIALRRLAGTAHSKVNAAQWGAVCGHLDEAKQSALEALLVVDLKTQRSPFADPCCAPGRASRKNLKALIDRYHWLEDLPDPTAALQSVADSKVLQWANEASRLNALELREYVTPRRQTLLLAMIRHARGQVLDDLTQMLLRLVRKVEWKSEQRLEQWYADRQAETDSLIRAFHNSLIVHGMSFESELAGNVQQHEQDREKAQRPADARLRFPNGWKPGSR
jgi:Domain of unknown function (DUF4158)